MTTFTFQVHQDLILRRFLKQKGLSKGMRAQARKDEDNLLVNGHFAPMRYPLKKGDVVTFRLTKEHSDNLVESVPGPLDILFEDAHFLIVNKPSGLASIPPRFGDKKNITSHIKAYYQEKRYESDVVHVVTRLDRETSGVMLVAKHRYSHGLISEMMKNKEIQKEYLAFTTKPVSSATHGFIDLPIGRVKDSILLRQVDEKGKQAKTEFFLEKEDKGVYRYRVLLHTGRTHQIRVHFSYLGAPLIGDHLYGGKQFKVFDHLGLHCRRLSFVHPITKQVIDIQAPLPDRYQVFMRQN